MTRTMGTKSKLVAALCIASVLLLGTFAGSAGAEERRDEYRGGDHRVVRGYERGWGGRYYLSPPVVYGPPAYYPQPAYYPPPVVYGPAIGIVLPGISIGIQ